MCVLGYERKHRWSQDLLTLSFLLEKPHLLWQVSESCCDEKKQCDSDANDLWFQFGIQDAVNSE